MERSKCISNLRGGIICDEFRSRFPRIAQLVSSMVAECPSVRPSASDLLKSVFCKEASERIELEDEVVKLRLLVKEKDEEIVRLKEQLCEMSNAQK
jgi:hypothetical protein